MVKEKGDSSSAIGHAQVLKPICIMITLNKVNLGGVGGPLGGEGIENWLTY